MERPFRRVRLLSLILLSAVVASGARAAAIEKKDQIQVAALALPGGPQADWQQWDSFLTNVVKKLGADFQPALRDQLGETFLDSRYQLVQLLRAGSADPVPQLLFSLQRGPGGLARYRGVRQTRYGKKSTMRSGPSSRRLAPARSLT